MTRSIAVGLGALLFIVAAVEARGAPTERERARAKVIEGGHLLAEHHYSAALARFQEAHAIFPSAKIYYNMALAYRGLGKNAEAFRALERFLREARDASPENLSQAREAMGQLASKLAFVALSVDVDATKVFLDGVAVGTTPLPSRLPVDAGPHDLLIDSREHGTRSRTFTVVPGESIELKFDLRSAKQTTILPPPEFPAVEQRHAGAAGGAGAVTSREVAGRDARSSSLPWLALARWGTSGAAAVATATGIFFHARSAAKRGDFGKRGCGEIGNMVIGPAGVDCQGLADEFRTARTRSIVGYVAGGTLAATAVVLFLVGGGSELDSAFLPGTTASPIGATYAKRF